MWYTHELRQCAMFGDRLFSLSMMFSVTASLHTLLRGTAKSHAVVWIHHMLCTHSSVDELLGCFHSGAVRSYAAVNL